VALRMLAVGEKGGNMGEMLEQIAAFHDEELRAGSTGSRGCSSRSYGAHRPGHRRDRGADVHADLELAGKPARAP